MSKPQIAIVQENTYQQLSAGDVVKRLRDAPVKVQNSSINRKPCGGVDQSHLTTFDFANVPEHLF